MKEVGKGGEQGRDLKGTHGAAERASCKSVNEFEGCRDKGIDGELVDDGECIEGEGSKAYSNAQEASQSSEGAKDGKPEVLGVVALGEKEGESEHGDGEESKRRQSDDGDVVVPLSGLGRGESFGDIRLIAEFDLAEDSAAGGDAIAGPCADGDDDGLGGVCTGEGDNEGRGLIRGGSVGHAAGTGGFVAVDVDGELAGEVAGDEQGEQRIVFDEVEAGELLRLEAQPVPGVAGVGVEHLVNEQLAYIHVTPGRVVEGGVGPAGVVADGKAPGSVELEDGVNGGGRLG